ncbi:MAG: hypothetical protein AAF417_11645 [Pseudomonadota bacterium]
MEPPDTYERGVRFGCGFFAGLVFYGLFLVIWFDAAGLVIALVVSTGCGIAAMVYGEAFWRGLKNWWWF